MDELELPVEMKIKLLAADVMGSIYPNYSGRGMFGKTCVGITCKNPTFCIETASADYGFKGAKVDNMGLDYIVYWPKIKGE